MQVANFIDTLDTKKPLLLSLDLDDTLVIRSKGDNYVPEKTQEIIKKIQTLLGVHILINTGRDYIGTQAFQENGCPIKDALMMSGAISMVGNTMYGYRNAILDESAIQFFYNQVKIGNIPFIDCTGKGIRKIFFNPSTTDPDLYFSQNPRKRFVTFPEIVSIVEIENEKQEWFRIEFPVAKNDPLFPGLQTKDPHILSEFNVNFGSNFSVDSYRLNKKNFFGTQEKKDNRCFARFERSRDYCNKGLGLQYRIELQNMKTTDRNIIHIGDQDEGVINDTLVKKYIPHAQVVMVGDKCKKNNSHVSLYLEGEREIALYQFLEQVYFHYSALKILICNK